MKIKFSIKDPNIDDRLREIEDEDVRDELIRKFFRYSEYVDIEIDTDTMTARVVEQ